MKNIRIKLKHGTLSLGFLCIGCSLAIAIDSDDYINNGKIQQQNMVANQTKALGFGSLMWNYLYQNGLQIHYSAIEEKEGDDEATTHFRKFSSFEIKKRIDCLPADTKDSKNNIIFAWQHSVSKDETPSKGHSYYEEGKINIDALAFAAATSSLIFLKSTLRRVPK
jgi:hypothetical protein